MLIFAHIFIGKEFKDLVSSIGRATFKYGGSTANANINYLIADSNKGHVSLSRLRISSSASDIEFESFEKFIKTEWDDNAYTASTSDLSTKWPEIYGDLIGDGDNADNLNVVLHFPIYKSGSFDTAKNLYEIISKSNLPADINFFGYSEDLAKSINEKEKSDSSAKGFAVEYTSFRNKQELPDSCHLILLQNCNRLGIPKRFNQEMLAEVISQFALACAEYYKQLFPNVVNYRDVVSFGISTLQVDRFLMANYLIHRSVLDMMDKVSVKNEKVDVNLANRKALTILKNKTAQFSEFLKMNSSCEMEEVHAYFKDKADKIVENCDEVIKKEKDITMRASILASLLSKTDCPLFSQSVFDTETERVYDLFSEAIDYFLENDFGLYLQGDEETPLINPIPVLKEVDSMVINTESEIRHLEKEHEMLTNQIETTSKIETCFIEDGVFHFNDNEYRLMPSLKEELLEETYEAKADDAVLPGSVDLRGGFRPAQSQGKQCSCLSFAMTSAFEYAMRNNTSEEIDLSEAFLYYNARLKDEYDDVSTSVDNGSRFKPTVHALCEYGIAREEFCKYDENIFTEKPSDAAYSDAATRRLIKALNVAMSVKDIKSALSEGYPVITSFELYDSFAQASGDGYVSMPTQEDIDKRNNNAQEEKHSSNAMVITGYSDQLQRFIVRNSWGKEWGDNGYCYIPYSYIESKYINMACILTEIHSFEKVRMIEIPNLTVDNNDLTIRYYINQALLDSNRKELVTLKQKREDLLTYFETLVNRLASLPSDRDAYIHAGLKKIQERIDVAKEQLRENREKTEQNKKDMHKFNIKVTAFSALAVTAVLTLIYIWNSIFDSFDLGSWKIGYLKSLYVIVPLLLIILYKSHSRWKEFKDLFYELEITEKRLLKHIAENEGIMKNLKFKTFVAWHCLREANRVRSIFSDLYTKYISLINNLRAWYNELENANDCITLDLEQPNISLLDKENLDKLYNDVIVKDPKFEIDFCDDMKNYCIEEEYLKTYKEKLISAMLLNILTYSDIKNFNMTRHIVEDGIRVDWVKPVDREVTTSWTRKADIFIQLSKSADPSMQSSQYILAPDTGRYTNAIHNCIGGFYSDLEIKDNYRALYINIAPLRIEDCAMFEK